MYAIVIYYTAYLQNHNPVDCKENFKFSVSSVTSFEVALLTDNFCLVIL